MAQYISVSVTQSGLNDSAQSGIGAIASTSAAIMLIIMGRGRAYLSLLISRFLAGGRRLIFHCSGFFQRFTGGGPDQHDFLNPAQCR